MKQTIYNEMLSLDRLEHIFAFFADPQKPLDALKQIKGEREEMEKAYKALELGNKKKGLDAAVVLAETELKSVLSKVSEAKKKAKETTDKADSYAKEASELLLKDRKELQAGVTQFEKYKEEANKTLEATQHALLDREAAIEKREQETARIEGNAKKLQTEAKARIKAVNEAYNA